VSDRQLCTFRLAEFTFGIDVQRVQEVLRAQTMTPVPLANDVVEGLINLRGQIVTALDLRRRLELPLRGPDDEDPMNVVVSGDDGALALLVDAIGDVVEADDATFEPPPDNLAGIARELIRGAYKLDGMLLLLLDVDKAVQLPSHVEAVVATQREREELAAVS